MKKSTIGIFLFFAVLIGTIAATHYWLTHEKVAEGMSCTDKRMASYGYTHKSLPVAELAAIQIWQRDTEQRDPGYGKWHLAYKRSMKCRRFGDSNHFQCIVSALPCKFESS